MIARLRSELEEAEADKAQLRDELEKAPGTAAVQAPFEAHGRGFAHRHDKVALLSLPGERIAQTS